MPLTPPDGKHTYTAANGLLFWMDYQQKGPPWQAPTIRTEDPQVDIVLVPSGHRGDEIFLMRHHGTSIPFSRPDASTMMDDDRFDALLRRNPGHDLVIGAIGSPFKWITFDDRRAKLEDIPYDTSFRSRAEQNQMCDLFCDMMGWLAVHGVLGMSRGVIGKPPEPVRKGRVGFDAALQKRLDAGGYIDRGADL